MPRSVSDTAVESRRASFEALVEPLLKPLYATALGYVRNPTDAEDAVAETVLRAYRGFGQFEPGTNFRAWLFRILANHCINRHNRLTRTVEAVGYEEVEREAEVVASRLQSPALAPESALFDDLLDEEIQAALADLPPEFRTVVLLSDLHEYTYQEIADFLGVPLGTVKSRVFRGRRLLQEALRDYATARGLVREAGDA